MFYVLLGFINGLLIGLSRVVNSRLGGFVGALASSVWNHLVGLVVLLIAGFFVSNFFQWEKLSNIPWYYCIGGLLGACFVTLNSVLIPRIGAFRSIILIVAGEMIGGVFLDYYQGKSDELFNSLFGAVFIILGLAVKAFDKKTNSPT